MAKLTDTQVRRAGVTARRWTSETGEVHIQIPKNLPKKLAIKFKLASKGGGTTDVEVLVGAKDFGKLLAAMGDLDKHAALKAMSTELAQQITSLKA